MQTAVRVPAETEWFELNESAVADYGATLADDERRQLASRIRAAQWQLFHSRADADLADVRALAAQTHAPAAYLLIAEAQMLINDWHNAEATLQELERWNAELAENNLLRGLILAALHQPAEARQQLQLAVQRKPGLRLAWKALMQLALDEGKLYEAARLFSEALRYGCCHPNFLTLQSCLHGEGPPLA